MITCVACGEKYTTWKPIVSLCRRCFNHGRRPWTRRRARCEEVVMTLNLEAIRARASKVAEQMEGTFLGAPDATLALVDDVAKMADAIEQYRELIQALEEKGLVVVHEKGWIPFPGTADPSQYSDELLASYQGGSPDPAATDPDGDEEYFEGSTPSMGLP